MAVFIADREYITIITPHLIPAVNLALWVSILLFRWHYFQIRISSPRSQIAPFAYHRIAQVTIMSFIGITKQIEFLIYHPTMNRTHSCCGHIL